MAEGRQDEDWLHTSFLLAQIHNSQCADRRKLKSPNDCNPLVMSRRKRLKRFDVERLKMMSPAYLAHVVGRQRSGSAGSSAGKPPP